MPVKRRVCAAVRPGRIGAMHLALTLALLLAQDVDQQKVDAAIRKGVDYLRGQVGGLEKPMGASHGRSLELVLWTFAHAGVPEDDEEFRKLHKTMMETDLERTYNVSLQAMILEEVDRVKYQWRIHQCAQFLADNQAKNGQWGYGEPSLYVKDIPTETVRKDVATGGAKPVPKDKRGKPKVQKTLRVEKKKDGPDFGDNSNSQYAALGLRACHDAGVLMPDKVLKAGEAHWRGAQKQGRGARGWGYNAQPNEEPYGSMSAGAVGSLVIFLYMQRRDWTRDRDVADGMAWLAENFTVEKNHKAPATIASQMLYYYLYALERAGILYGTETMGRHKWYPLGANFLIKAQRDDGSWSATEPASSAVWDTCWAILFLRRATRPLKDVATGDTKK